MKKLNSLIDNEQFNISIKIAKLEKDVADLKDKVIDLSELIVKQTKINESVAELLKSYL